MAAQKENLFWKSVLLLLLLQPANYSRFCVCGNVICVLILIVSVCVRARDPRRTKENQERNGTLSTNWWNVHFSREKASSVFFLACSKQKKRVNRFSLAQFELQANITFKRENSTRKSNITRKEKSEISLNWTRFPTGTVHFICLPSFSLWFSVTLLTLLQKQQ